MPLLQARDVPQDLYDRLGEAAAADRRSIAQEVIVLLEQALEPTRANHHRRHQTLDRAAHLAKSTPNNPLNPVELIREDRDR